MKKFLFMFVLILSLLAAGASAAIDLSATSEPLALSGNPGSTINGQFQVSNTETTDHTVAFSGYQLSHNQDSTKKLNINSISNLAVQAGTNQAASFSITNTNVFAGTYTGTLTGTSTTNNALTDNLQLQITVNSDPSATAASASFEAGRGISKTVSNAFSITNNGNTDLNSVSVSVADLTDGTNTLPQGYISFSPSSTSINYGNSENIDITTNIPATQAAGTYTGDITVNYGSGTATATLSVTVRDPLHEVKIQDSEEVKVGSSTQEREQNTYQDFTVENTGDYTESVTLALSGMDNDFNAQLSTSSFTLQPGQTQTVRLTATIPDDQDSGVQTEGSLGLTFNQQTVTYPVKVETKSMLEITKIETKVGGDDSDSDLDDGDTLSDEAKPGDDIEFEITVKNIFSESQDNAIEDIEIRLEPHDSDFDEVEADEKFDLNENRDRRKTLTIEVPEKINEGTYDVDIIVEGEDENGATHSVFWTVSFEIEKEDHDIRITESTLGTSTLGCVRSTDLRVTIANYGAEEEEDAALVIWAPDLGINENIMDIYLDSDFEDDDNEYTKTVSIDLDDDFPAGTYQITLRAYRNNDKEMEQKIISLKVEDCVEEEEEEEEPVVVVTPATGGQTGTSGSSTSGSTNVVETVETSFTNSTAFIVLLIGLDLIILLVVLVLIFKFLF